MTRMNFINDAKYLKYLDALMKKSESDLKIIETLISLPKSENFLSQLNVNRSIVEMLEVIRKPVPQKNLLVKIINSTYEGIEPSKKNYTCITFDLKWPLDDLNDDSKGVFDSRISKGTTSYC